jgi:predicted secreted hydrolase
VQQLLLEPDDAIGAHLLTADGERHQQQLYALRVALSGCAVVGWSDPDIFATGELCLYIKDQVVELLCNLVRLQHVCD